MLNDHTKRVLRERARRIVRDTRNRIDARRGASVPLEGVIIGVGAQKAGTSWLARALAEHPDIYAREKEVHYWDVVRYPYIGWDPLGRGASALNSVATPFGAHIFDHSQYVPSLSFGRTTQRFVAETSPSYALLRGPTFSDMAKVHANVKFIFLMRDPVERLWSSVKHRVRLTLNRDPDFSGLERLFLEACDNPHDPDFLRSRYDETLMGLDQSGAATCTMFFETLFSQDSLQQVADFVGVDSLPGRFGSVKNAGAKTSARLSDRARAHARGVLAPTYDFVADRFGDRVPDAWKG